MWPSESIPMATRRPANGHDTLRSAMHAPMAVTTITAALVTRAQRVDPKISYWPICWHKYGVRDSVRLLIGEIFDVQASSHIELNSQ